MVNTAVTGQSGGVMRFTLGLPGDQQTCADCHRQPAQPSATGFLDTEDWLAKGDHFNDGLAP